MKDTAVIISIYNYLEPLDNYFGLNSDLVNTFIYLFENNFNFNLVSKLVYRHRNTLVYWMHKLDKLTGLDVMKDHEARFIIYMYLIIRGHIKTEQFGLSDVRLKQIDFSCI